MNILLEMIFTQAKHQQLETKLKLYNRQKEMLLRLFKEASC